MTAQRVPRREIFGWAMFDFTLFVREGRGRAAASAYCAEPAPRPLVPEEGRV